MSFSRIYEQAVLQKGGENEVRARLPRGAAPGELEALLKESSEYHNYDLFLAVYQQKLSQDFDQAFDDLKSSENGFNFLCFYSVALFDTYVRRAYC